MTSCTPVRSLNPASTSIATKRALSTMPQTWLLPHAACGCCMDPKLALLECKLLSCSAKLPAQYHTVQRSMVAHVESAANPLSMLRHPMQESADKCVQTRCISCDFPSCIRCDCGSKACTPIYRDVPTMLPNLPAPRANMQRGALQAAENSDCIANVAASAVVEACML